MNKKIGSLGVNGRIIPTPEQLEILAKCRELIKMLYYALREDERLARDYQLCVRLQTPALSLTATLANASASNQIGYFERGVRFARSHCAEFREMLNVAQDVRAIEEDNYHDLHTRTEEIYAMLASLSSALERRVVGE